MVSEVWEGPFPVRERTVRPESKDSIFNRIAASEGASHGSETLLSSATPSAGRWPDHSEMKPGKVHSVADGAL